MAAKLLFRDPTGADQAVDVPEATPIFMGRGVDCPVRTDDAMVSRKNAKVSVVGGRAFVEDLGSANGTYVNERRIQKQQLNHNDVIRCGTLQVRYVEVAASQVPQTSAQPPRRSTQEVYAQTPADALGQDVAVQPVFVGGQAGDAQVSAAVAQERDAAKKQLEEQKQELDGLRTKLEASETELRRLRSEAVSGRDEIAKAKRDAAQDKEELQAVTRVAEELKKSLQKAQDENVGFKTRVDELTEDRDARDRQLERAQEDLARTKGTIEELRNKLAELQKTKDEGWKELNSHLSEIEHLREVISEQERILEERRVGLISLESAAKDLRAEKEKILRELVDTKNQRDELKDKLARAEAKIEGLEEEHRRLARAMNEGGAQNADEMSRLAEELRNLKVEYKKLQSDKDRAADALVRAEADRQRLADDKAKLDVERAQLAEDKKAAEVARGRAEEARAKAETMRQRADDEKKEAAAARDAALASSDELRRNVERAERRAGDAEKRVVEAEKKMGELQRALQDAASAPAAAAPAAVDPKVLNELADARDAALEAKTHAEARAVELDEELDEARAQAEKHKAALEQAQAELARAKADLAAQAARAPAVSAAAAAGGDAADLRAKAQEVYDGINSALSELRTTMITARALFSDISKSIADEDQRKALGDALNESMDRTEDAKGLLRGLRVLAQG